MTYKPASKGFSLFELVVVICVIAVLFVFATKFYLQHIEESQRQAVQHQAAAFLRTVDNIHALASIGNKRQLTLESGVTFYLNRYGWPVSSSELAVNARRKVSDEACRSLWLGLFSELGDKQEGFGKERFQSGAANTYQCRFSLSRKQESRYSFVYDSSSGRVTVLTNYEEK